MSEMVDGVRGRFDLVSGLRLSEFSRSGYQSMLGQLGGTVPRPFYADGAIGFGRFSIPIPETRLLQLLETKRDRHVIETAGSMHTFSGMAAKDGSESYRLRRVNCIFEECSKAPSAREPSPRPMNFSFLLDIEIGAPISETFILSDPQDLSERRYWGSLQVVWSAVWKFFVAPTKQFAQNLRECVQANHGFDIGEPPYNVSDRRA